MDAPTILVVDPAPRDADTSFDTRLHGTVEVGTTTVNGLDVVHLDIDGTCYDLTRSDALNLVYAVLGRLGIIGFPDEVTGADSSPFPPVAAATVTSDDLIFTGTPL